MIKLSLNSNVELYIHKDYCQIYSECSGLDWTLDSEDEQTKVLDVDMLSLMRKDNSFLIILWALSGTDFHYITFDVDPKELEDSPMIIRNLSEIDKKIDVLSRPTDRLKNVIELFENS